jgi:hypothetical protein
MGQVSCQAIDKLFEPHPRGSIVRCLYCKGVSGESQAVAQGTVYVQASKTTAP